ncbi:hypothetical protein ACFFOM_06190 [Microlunatus capsulatus]|uniref:Uncharacterized protein n=1 Tax=Microlunatus capsulatus TaxID=99117 RepID=A0ABS4Z5I4_9ACTN|nr:hypothetical protein [Microlunatus capsulatus]MBP2416305.1 hypothetical protein [Microlunatus capsulatus]
MDAPTTTLLRHLLDDRPDPAAAPAAVVAAHAVHRDGPHADVLGRLVVPDTALVATGRARSARPGPVTWPVAVDVDGGAGGVAALAGRSADGLRVEAVRTGLRDLDDPAGGVARIAAAASALEDVEVFVELPDVPGWVRAVEVVEAAGLLARVGVGPGTDPVALARRLSVLVEADLPFAAVLPAAPRSGLAVLALAMLVEALVDGAEAEEAAALLAADPDRVRSGLARWDAATAGRVRRRLRSVGTDVGAALADLEALGVLGRG